MQYCAVLILYIQYIYTQLQVDGILRGFHNHWAMLMRLRCEAFLKTVKVLSDISAIAQL